MTQLCLYWGEGTQQLKEWLVVNLQSLPIHSISLWICKQRELLFILLSFTVGIPNFLMYFNLRKSHPPHSTSYLYTTAFSDQSSSIIFWVSVLPHLKSLRLTTSQRISKLLSKTSSNLFSHTELALPNSKFISKSLQLLSPSCVSLQYSSLFWPLNKTPLYHSRSSSMMTISSLFLKAHIILCSDYYNYYNYITYIDNDWILHSPSHFQLLSRW